MLVMYGLSGLRMVSNVSIVREGVGMALGNVSPDASHGLSCYDYLCRNLRHYITLTSGELVICIIPICSQGHRGVSSVVVSMKDDNGDRLPVCCTTYFGASLSFYPFKAGEFDGNCLSLVKKCPEFSSKRLENSIKCELHKSSHLLSEATRHFQLRSLRHFCNCKVVGVPWHIR